MSTRREKRKQAKLQSRAERAQISGRRKVALGFGSLIAIGAVAGVAGYQYSHRAEKGRAVASLTQAHGANGPSGPAGKSVEEVSKEVDKKNDMQKKAKEWTWAEEGHTELVIEAYRKVTGANTHAHEERVRLLHALERNAKPRAQWPAEMTMAKARDVLDLITEVMAAGHQPGPEGTTAIHLWVAYGQNIPEFKSRAETAIYQYYEQDDRPAVRSACLDSLSKLGSLKGLVPLEKTLRGEDQGSIRSALYSASNYLGTAYSKRAQAAMMSVAEKNSIQRPLAAKLLAYHGVAQAARLVPVLLTDHSIPAEVEAAAYVIEQLKLTKYFELLKKYGRADSPYLQQQLDAAFKSAAPH